MTSEMRTEIGGLPTLQFGRSAHRNASHRSHLSLSAVIASVANPVREVGVYPMLGHTTKNWVQSWVQLEDDLHPKTGLSGARSTKLLMAS